MSHPTYSILIPAYNAKDSIGILLSQINEMSDHHPEHVFVVDDGSTDGTAEIVKEFAASIYKFNKNKGKGAALKKGFELILKESSSDYVLCMDADLQHPTASIASFLAKAGLDNDRIILGKRDLSIKKMPVMRFLSNIITSFMLSLLCNQKLSDSQCGFRLIHRNILKDISLKNEGFQFESEFLIRCAENSIKIDFVDIPTIYNSHSSNIRHFTDSFKFIRLISKETYNKWFIQSNVKK